MSSPILQPSSFNVSKITISQPKVLESGGKMAFLNYGERSRLVLQTPSLPSPFGLSVFDKAGPPKYSIDLAMRGYQENPKVKSLFTALHELDEYMIDQGVKNSKLWFKSDMKREVVSAFYTPCVKFGKDKEGNQTPYPPNIKLQLKRKGDGEFECQFYDQNSKGDPNAKPITGVPVSDMLVKKVEVTALMECTGVWFAGGKFGVSWKAVQMRLDSVPAGIHGCAFEDEAEPEEFSEPAAPPAKSADLDDEEEEESDEEVAPAPLPKKTTVVTKKKVVTAAKK